MSTSSYLLAGHGSELDRLQLQSRVWEPAGRRLLDEIGDGRGARAVDIGCGAMGWLRLLSEWAGPAGEVVGTDIDDAMLAGADRFVAAEGLGNVVLVKDDLFASELRAASFDLVHARFQLTPLGRVEHQLDAFVRLGRPGGIVVLEDLDPASWHFNPPAPALERLIELTLAVLASAGEPAAGRRHLELLRDAGIEANVRAEILALPLGHPYLPLPLQMAAVLEPRMRELVGADELERLRAEAEAELQQPGRWGTTFTLLQSWGRSPNAVGVTG
jgi:ubiquinone/menaquinone biosynthesis C-methylase UbiE